MVNILYKNGFFTYSQHFKLNMDDLGEVEEISHYYPTWSETKACLTKAQELKKEIQAMVSE